jgi:hypothetical protein
MVAQPVEKENGNGDQGSADDRSYEQDGVGGHPASSSVSQGSSPCWLSGATLVRMLSQRKILSLSVPSPETVKTLSLTIPPSVLLRADQVIE